MSRLTRPERRAVALWIVMSLVIGNTVYDLLVTRAVKEYMFRVALHQAGRGPLVSMADIVGPLTYDAVWIGLLFGSTVALAGFWTIRMLRVQSK